MPSAKPENETSSRKGRRGFPKGVSGNPKGRPKGSRNKATILVEKLLGDNSEALMQQGIDQALNGDTTLPKLLIELMLPRRKGRPVQLDLPRVETISDLNEAYLVVMEAVAKGDVTPDEATTIVQLLEGKYEVAQEKIKEEASPSLVFDIDIDRETSAA